MFNLLPTPFENIPGGLVANFYAYNPLGNGSQPADSAAISSFVDLSKSGFYTFGQAVSALQPSYQRNSLGFMPSIVFNNSVYLEGNNGNTSSNWTIIIVSRAAADITSPSSLFYNGDPGANGYGYIIDQGSRQVLFGGVVVHSAGSSTYNPEIAVISWDGTNLTVRINGSVTLSTTSWYFGTPSPSKSFLGGDGYAGQEFTGNIFQLLQYNRTLSINEIQVLEKRLGEKFGIPIA